MRILGIDPGSRLTGYGVVEAGRGGPQYIACGCIRSEHGELPERLGVIYRGVGEVIGEFAPTALAIEQVFVARNPDSALKLGQARGVAIAAAVAARLPVAEYAARSVKQAVTGTGGAPKEQVQQMVRLLLKLPSAPRPDAADALAIAICHVNTAGL